MLGLQLPQTDIEQDDSAVEVWDVNAVWLELFLALTTQWNAVSVGGGLAPIRIVWLGIDYRAADMVIRRHGFEDTDGRPLEMLQVMEEAALAAMNGDA